MRYFIIFIILFPLIAFSQEPVSVHLTEKDGLPDIEFYNILEDKKGFVWLCADKGLYRFDGKTYKSYSNNTKRGLSVFEPFEDYLGRIWVTNISGQFFYIEDNKLITFIDLQKELNGVLASFFVTKNEIIVNTINKVFSINLKTKEKKIILKTRNAISKLHIRNDSFLSISKDSLYEINKNFKNIKKQKLVYPSKRNIDFEGLPQILKFRNRIFIKYFYNRKNQFFELDKSTNKLLKIDGLNFLEPQRITNFKEVGNKLWISTNNGVYKFDLIKNKFIVEDHFLKNEYVTSQIIDKDFNYWFLTWNNGIFILPNIEVKNYNLPEHLVHVNCEVKINDSILGFGTRNGYYTTLNLNNNTFKTTKVSTSQVSSLYYNKKNNKGILSTDDNSFFIENKRLKEIGHRSLGSSKSLSEIDDNHIVFCNYSSTGIYNIKDNSVESISEGKRVYKTFYDKESKALYIGYVDNLTVYKDGVFSPITYNNRLIFTTSITQTLNGIVWVATFKDGVFAIKNNTVIANYTIKDGLTSNEIEYLQSDGNNLWIANAKGLQFLNTKTKDIKTLYKTDGVLSYKITGVQLYDNQVVCASNKGIFKFDKTKVFKRKLSKSVYFTHITINNELKQELKNSYTLDYNKNAIEIGFNINGYSNTTNTLYDYRLLGFNDDWITTSKNEDFVKYNSLSPGNYEFQVKLHTNNTERVKSIVIIIKSPFWKTWWFIFLSFLLLFILCFILFKNIIKKKEKQRINQVRQLSLDKELVTLKLENLRSQMNPHFIFNALNSIQEYIILNQKKIASDYLSKFAKLIRTYLEHSKKGEISLEEEIECLKMYLDLEKMRFEDKLNYSLVAHDFSNLYEIKIPTMLIQPYVENAIKHGLLHRETNRKLNIDFYLNRTDKLLVCIIEDNGLGRSFSEAYKNKNLRNHKSFATQANNDRLNLLNNSNTNQVGVKITDLFNNNKPSGTRVEITIPYTV